MSKINEAAKASPPLHELLGVPANQSSIFEPRKLLEMLLSDDGKSQFIKALAASTNKPWTEEMILGLLSGKNSSDDEKRIPTTSSRELSEPKELITSAISKAKLVWLKAMQTIDIMAVDQGAGLSCVGVSAHELISGFSYAGERNISSYGSGMLGSSKDNFAMFCLDPSNYGQNKTSFENIWGEIKQNGLAARVTDTEYFLMGRFSSEKRFISPDRKSGRNRDNNYMRIKFATPEELLAFLDILKSTNPTASELLSSLATASLNGVNSLPTRSGNALNTNSLLEVVGQVGFDVKIPEPTPFSEQQIKDIASLRLDRVEDVR